MRTPRSAFTLTELFVVIACVAVLLSLALPALQRVRESGNRVLCTANLRQIGLALKLYHQDKGQFPPALTGWDTPQPFLSWQARLLPYLSEQSLWMQVDAAFKANPMFWTPPHQAIAGRALPVYLCPSDDRLTTDADYAPDQTYAFTFYQGVAGRRHGTGMLYQDSRVRLGDVKDGLSQTLFVGERPPSSTGRYGWWYAGIGQAYDGSLDSHLLTEQRNYSPYAPHCPRGPYSFQPGHPRDMCSSFHFWSRHPGGAHFLFVDGHVQFLRYSARDVLPELSTRAGGEPVSVPD